MEKKEKKEELKKPDNIIPIPESEAPLEITNTDNILYLAEKAEQYVEALNKIMRAALKITNERDWILISGNPYLQESGSTKIARLFGISWQLLGQPRVETDAKGYKTYTYKGRFMLRDQYVEAEGTRSMKDKFFTGKSGKSADEIDERDVKQSAYTNLINNGIKRIIPSLRNISLQTLEEEGIDVNKIEGYTFRTGSNGGTSKTTPDEKLKCESCGKAVTQKVASFSQSKFEKILCMDCQKKEGAK